METLLCFTDTVAPWRSGELSNEQYYHILLQHFCGVRHHEDTDLADSPELRKSLTSVAESVWLESTQTSYVKLAGKRESSFKIKRLQTNDTVQDLDMLIRVFLSAEKGDIQDVQHALATLTKAEPLFPIPYNSLAMLGWQKQSTLLLRLAINGGGSVPEDVTYMVGSERISAEFYDLLWQSDWQRMRSLNRLPDAITNVADLLNYPTEVLTWLLEHGLILTKEHVKRSTIWHDVPYQVENLAAIIRHQGDSKIFEGTDLLAEAVFNGKTQVVELLLAAGLDPNEATAEPRDIRGEHSPFWPLYDAVLTKREGMVKLLLEYGADPLQVLPRNGLTLIQLAERMGERDRIVGMLRLATLLP